MLCMSLGGGKVRHNTVDVLRDTGYKGVIVKREFTGRMGYVIAIDQSL